jgi:Uma2 family endonuclease
MMPVSGPRWLDDFPEYLTEADYRDLSEEFSRTIEIVHGHVIKSESPTPRHNRIARRLANALEDARSPVGPCLTVDTDVDVVLWRVPRFTFRRPGVAVYQCIDDPARKPTAEDTVLVIEVASPTTAREDLVDKKALGPGTGGARQAGPSRFRPGKRLAARQAAPWRAAALPR